MLRFGNDQDSTEKSRENGKINQKKAGAPRRALNKVLYGEPFPARGPALNLLYAIFEVKDTSFVCLLSKNRNPFKYLDLESYIPGFSWSKCTVSFHSRKKRLV